MIVYMLIFTYKLERYIKKRILPLILPDKTNYIIKGSFKRRAPYVTDIDVVNYVYPEINRSNIYEIMVNLMETLPNDIILIYIKCGEDSRFKIEKLSNDEMDKIIPFIAKDDLEQIQRVTEKYSDQYNKKLFYVSEILRKYYRYIWTRNEVLENTEVIRNGIKTNFKDVVENNSSLTLKYFINYESYPIGIDAIVEYEPRDQKLIYLKAAERQIKLANYSEEYYYMMFPLRFYFRKDHKILSELENLIEKKFGLYKQLAISTKTYNTLYKSQNLDIKTATKIITDFLNDVKKLPEFNSSTIDQIKKISTDNPPEIKMKEWDKLMKILYDEINAEVNYRAKPYFFKYLKMVPVGARDKYYLNS